MGSGKPIELPFKGHADRVTSMALSEDNRKLVSASLDNTVRVWDAQTGLPTELSLKGDIHGVISLAFSPDGSQFAGVASDSTIRLWDSESCKLLASYHKDHINEMMPIFFSPDGKQLRTFSIDGIPHAWDAANGNLLEAPEPPSISWLDSCKPVAISGEHGRHPEDANDALLRGFPMDNPDFGYWAIIDGKCIRRDRNGLLTITDISLSKFGLTGTGRESH
jgi:WD40 repeat protein